MEINKHLGIRFRVILLTSVLFCGIAAIETTAIRAQTFSLSIYPPLLEVMMMPGKSITQAYKLTNTGETTVINTQIVTFEPADELGNIKLVNSNQWSVTNENSPITNWFSFDNANIALGKPFTLASGKSQQIILRIKVPENTREDDYYFTLLFSSKPGERIGQSATQEVGVIGGNILLTVSRDGKPLKKGEIIEFRLRRKGYSLTGLIDSLDKPEFILRVRNTGKAYFKTFGKIEIGGLLGQKGELPILPENILVNSTRRLSGSCPGETEEEKIPCPLIFAPKFLIGPYRAKVIMNLDEGGPEISATTSFLALPIKAIIGLLTALVLLFIIKSILLRSR